MGLGDCQDQDAFWSFVHCKSNEQCISEFSLLLCLKFSSFTAHWQEPPQMSLEMRNMDRGDTTVKEIWSMSKHVRTSSDESMTSSSLCWPAGQSGQHDQTCGPAQQLSRASSSPGSCLTLTWGTIKNNTNSQAPPWPWESAPLKTHPLQESVFLTSVLDYSDT